MGHLDRGLAGIRSIGHEPQASGVDNIPSALGREAVRTSQPIARAGI